MVEIVSIGDELLIGQVVNTNASWMAEELNQAGFLVRQITNVSDNGDEIKRALTEASQRANIILLTGGLGPTKDDITKSVLCEFFNTHLVVNEKVLEGVQSFFTRKGLPLTRLNYDQALVPASAYVVENPVGTAPGLVFEKEGKLYVSMPGVPYEMQHIMTSYVIPRLEALNEGSVIVHRTILTQGIGESFMAEKIKDWEEGLAPLIKLAYLPSPGIVRLRLTMRGTDKLLMESILEEKVVALKSLLPRYIWGEGKQSLEEVVGQLLKQNGKTLSTAESCTGGYIAHRITSVPGSSGWFQGSIVAYDSQVKTNLLNVKQETLELNGAVSQPVVEEMALGVIERLHTDYSIGISGIAGPEGGTPDQPVGTTWICVARKDGVVISRKFLFGDQRFRNILRGTNAALAMLREIILLDFPAQP